MTNKRKIIVSSFVTVIAVGAIGVSVANANLRPNGERHAMVQDAIKNNDLKAFKQATSDCPMAKQVNTQKDFEAITLAYDLRQERKYKESREVLHRAGIEHPGKIGRQGPRVDMRDAIENNDWAEFQEVTQGKQIANTINTEEKFNLFVEAHELRKDGQYDEAREIMQELGFQGKRSHFTK